VVGISDGVVGIGAAVGGAVNLSAVNRKPRCSKGTNSNLREGFDPPR
jgi:hypothetical protein